MENVRDIDNAMALQLGVLDDFIKTLDFGKSADIDVLRDEIEATKVLYEFMRIVQERRQSLKKRKRCCLG